MAFTVAAPGANGAAYAVPVDGQDGVLPSTVYLRLVRLVVVEDRAMVVPGKSAPADGVAVGVAAVSVMVALDGSELVKPAAVQIADTAVPVAVIATGVE
jgi:hypothetical protein